MICVTLPVGPSLNGMFKNAARGRVKTAKYTKWITDAGWALNASKARSVASPVCIIMRFGKLDVRSDISNRCKALEDLLVTHKIIEDDSVNHVTRILLDYVPDEIEPGLVKIFVVTRKSK